MSPLPVQTFLPFPSFAWSAAVLDDRRLGKQRVEVLQILRALHLEGYGWANHPAVLMWRGHTRALVAYGLAVVAEWRRRGHGDTTAANISEFACPATALDADRLPAAELPPWLGRDDLHRSHRAALVRKDPAVYGPEFPDVPPDLPYVWPPPPAAAPPAAPLSAWAVRPATDRLAAAFLDRGVVGLPADVGGHGASPKQRQQPVRLRDVVAVGDRIVVTTGDRLHTGTVTGPAEVRRLAGTRVLVRDVAWDVTLVRSSLCRPYQLQDPQLVFALRGEPVLQA